MCDMPSTLTKEKYVNHHDAEKESICTGKKVKSYNRNSSAKNRE